MGSASAAIATAPPPSKAIPSASPTSSPIPARKVTDIPGIGKGLAVVLRRDRRSRLLRAPRSAAAKVPAHRARIPEDSGPRAEKHRAHLRALPHQHHRRAGAAVPGAEAARAAAHGRQAGREGAALHRAIPHAHRPLPAELRREHGRGADRRSAQAPASTAITPAGSLRRGRETVGDLDLLVTGPDADRRARPLRRLSARRGGAGPRRKQSQRQGGPRGLAGGRARAAARQLRRRHAILHRQQGSQRGHAHARREDGAEAQRVRPVPRRRTMPRWPAKPKPAFTKRSACPGFRRSCARICGEIEAAAEGRLPELVELADIRGDLHMHTTETDGRATLEEMAAAARERGYEYIAITDHSKALAMANGLDEKRVVAFARQVRETQSRRPRHPRLLRPRVRHPARMARMDLANDALAELDLVIGSVHSHMNHGSRRNDRPPAARARMPAPAHPRPSHRPHSAASRSVPLRFRARRRRGRAPRRVAGNQRQPRAARPQRHR